MNRIIRISMILAVIAGMPDANASPCGVDGMPSPLCTPLTSLIKRPIPSANFFWFDHSKLGPLVCMRAADGSYGACAKLKELIKMPVYTDHSGEV